MRSNFSGEKSKLISVDSEQFLDVELQVDFLGSQSISFRQFGASLRNFKDEPNGTHAIFRIKEEQDF